VISRNDSVSRRASASRRARAEAPRTESVRVRLSPDETAVVGEAAARPGMSVGAWVGETAVRRARAEADGAGPDEARGAGPSSWRELVAALVALRTEVAAGRRVPVVELGPPLASGELLDGQPAGAGPEDLDGGGVLGLLRRIDAVTAAASDSASDARRSSPVGRERSGRL
jgi:hypothetical protein